MNREEKEKDAFISVNFHSNIKMDEIFNNIQDDLSNRDNRKQVISDSIEELKNLSRSISFVLSGIHRAIGDEKALGSIYQTVDTNLSSLDGIWSNILTGKCFIYLNN